MTTLDEKISEVLLKEKINEAMGQGYKTKEDITNYIEMDLGILHDQTDEVADQYRHDKEIMAAAKQGTVLPRYLKDPIRYEVMV